MVLKKWFVFFWISFMSVGAPFVEASAQSQTVYPKITFTYDWRGRILDTLGSFYYGNSVTTNHVYALNKLLPSLIAAWERDAPILFGELFSRFNRGFKAKERTGLIYLSHGYSYGSDWFLIFGLRYYLDDESWLCSMSREDTFSSLVFHELLHVWVDENLNKRTSQIFSKYRNENAEVLNHVHLMAIQKMVYLSIKRPDVVEMLDTSYRTLQGPDYCRAWEIVNDSEGHEVVLRDMLINLI